MSNILMRELAMRDVHPAGGDDSSSYRVVREALVKAALTTLLKRDYPTQSMTSAYLDRRFETTRENLNLLNANDAKTARQLQESLAGWFMTKKIIVDERVDEVCALFAYACTTGGVQSDPMDLTMNAHRYYDVLRLITGSEFDFALDLSPTDKDSSLTRYARFKYIHFIAENLKPYVSEVKFDDIIMALYTMQFYQFVPCLAAAYRVFENVNSISINSMSVKLLEIKRWSEMVDHELMKRTKLSDTLEWVKFVPLFTHKGMLGQDLTIASFSLPMEETEFGEKEWLKEYLYAEVAPLFNFSAIDPIDKIDPTSYMTTESMLELAENELYHQSFNVTIRGLFLADDDSNDNPFLLDSYVKGIEPWLQEKIKASFVIGGDESNFLVTDAEPKFFTTNFETMLSTAKSLRSDIFTTSISYTARRILMSRDLRRSGGAFPLFYSFGGGEMRYDSGAVD